MTVTLYKNKSANNVIGKVLETLTAVSATHLKPMSVENPEIILASNHISTTGANYLYIDVFDRYYFITDYTVLSGGRISVSCFIDVLYTYRNQLLGSRVNVIRNQFAHINETPDNLLPIKPERHIRVLRFPEQLNNASFGAGTRCFILTVAGGGSGQKPPSVVTSQMTDKKEE